MNLTDKITITNEDCMELMSRYPDKYFELAIVDPPYGVLNFKWDNADNLAEWINTIYTKLKPDGSLICFGLQPMISNVIALMGSRFSHELIWEKTQKTNFMNANRMPLRVHENIAISKVNTGLYYKPIKEVVKNIEQLGQTRKQKNQRYEGYSGIKEGGIYTEDGLRHVTTIVKISNWNGALFGNTDNASIHPTQKPVDLYKWILDRYARPDAKILDCFIGSGSIAIACHDLGFELTGCELDVDYFNAAVKRINNHTAQLGLF